MKATPKQQAMQRCQRVIFQTIFANRLPDDAINWPVLEVIGGDVLHGFGEAAQYGSKVLVRLDGKLIKQVRSFRDPKAELMSDLQTELGIMGKLRYAGKLRATDTDIFVIEVGDILTAGNKSS